MLFKIALQVMVLIERTARQTSNTAIAALMTSCPIERMSAIINPNTCLSPSSISSRTVPIADDAIYGFVSKLNALQLEILGILEVSALCYSYQYLIDSS
jgi:hypothetical protein